MSHGRLKLKCQGDIENVRGTLRILNVPWDVENSQAFRRDAGKRLFLSQSLSRTEAKTELTVIMAMPWPVPEAATFRDQMIPR